MIKIILSILMLLSTNLFADDFILSSIEETLMLSNSSGKPALIVFGSSNCKFCDSLKNEVFNTKSIDNFIVCYIDISNEENRSIKNDYNVSLIPDSRIFFKNKEQSRFKGFQKSKYIQWLHDNE